MCVQISTDMFCNFCVQLTAPIKCDLLLYDWLVQSILKMKFSKKSSLSNIPTIRGSLMMKKEGTTWLHEFTFHTESKPSSEPLMYVEMIGMLSKYLHLDPLLIP